MYFSIFHFNIITYCATTSPNGHYSWVFFAEHLQACEILIFTKIGKYFSHVILIGSFTLTL